MAAFVVIDSGIALATVLRETYSSAAEQLIKSQRSANVQLAAPVLFRYEVIAVIRRSMAQGRITAERAIQARETLLEFPIQFYLDDVLLTRAFDLAVQLNRPTAYDSQYLAVAERLGCEFWTADERLFNAVSSQLAWVKWIGNLNVKEAESGGA